MLQAFAVALSLGGLSLITGSCPLNITVSRPPGVKLIILFIIAHRQVAESRAAVCIGVGVPVYSLTMGMVACPAFLRDPKVLGLQWERVPNLTLEISNLRY
jgi:hypothetical protein